MKTKEEIVNNWLPRYTDTPLNEFGRYILLTNFDDYLRMFSEWNGVPIHGAGMPMPNATAQGITIINFGMGSANAATVMDLLSAIQPKACLFLGKCGELQGKNQSRRSDPAHRRHPRRGHIQRLFSARGAGPAGLQSTKGHLDHHPQP